MRQLLRLFRLNFTLRTVPGVWVKDVLDFLGVLRFCLLYILFSSWLKWVMLTLRAIQTRKRH